MSVNLTKKQYNRLMNGHSVRVRPMENGDHELLLNKSEQTKARRAMKNSKAITIKKHHIKGAGFGKVMNKVKQSVSHQLNNEVMPIVQHHASMGAHTLKERAAEKLLENLGVPNGLAKELITSKNLNLSKKASESLDMLQNELESTMNKHGLVKGVDYDVDIHNFDMPVSESDVLKKYLPERTFTTGSGRKKKHHRVIYLKGSGFISFFKNLGNNIEKIATSKIGRNILKDIASTGVSTIAKTFTGSPLFGKIAGNVAGGVTQHMLGGALFVPMGRGISLPQPTKLSARDKRFYL